MIPFVIRRLVGLVPVMLVIVTCAFFLLRAAPGGPFDTEKQLAPEIRKNIEARYRMDRPLFEQYTAYVADLARGDFGPSYKYKNRSVNEILATGFPVSLQLGLVALAWALVVGLVAGMIAAVKQNTRFDYASMAVAMLGISLPSFVLGPLLVLVFALTLHWLPAARLESWKHLILPGLTLGAAYAAYIARLTRGGMLEAVRQDYVRTARAKGLGEARVILLHAAPLGTNPVLTFLGPALAALFTGSIVVERIFNIPGMGRYFIDGAINRDYTLVMGVVVTYSIFLLLMNLFVDVAYRLVDPRTRTG